jgi:hypothetical protein
MDPAPVRALTRRSEVSKPVVCDKWPESWLTAVRPDGPAARDVLSVQHKGREIIGVQQNLRVTCLAQHAINAVKRPLKIGHTWCLAQNNWHS